MIRPHRQTRGKLHITQTLEAPQQGLIGPHIHQLPTLGIFEGINDLGSVVKLIARRLGQPIKTASTDTLALKLPGPYQTRHRSADLIFANINRRAGMNNATHPKYAATWLDHIAI